MQLWDSLGIASSAVVGLGFCGSLALALGLEYTERVTRAAFCCWPRQPDDRHELWRGRCYTAQTQGMASVRTKLDTCTDFSDVGCLLQHQNLETLRHQRRRRRRKAENSLAG